MIKENAMHAAAVWLQRCNLDVAAVAVVNVSPVAAVGSWQPGADNIVMLTALDDAASELCEAAAPVVAEALQQLEPEALEAIAAASQRGARMQLLLAPAFGEITLRLVDDGRVVHLAGVDGDSTVQ